MANKRRSPSTAGKHKSNLELSSCEIGPSTTAGAGEGVMGCVATGGGSQGWGEAAVASGIIAALRVLICQGPWEVVLVSAPRETCS